MSHLFWVKCTMDCPALVYKSRAGQGTLVLISKILFMRQRHSKPTYVQSLPTFKAYLQEVLANASKGGGEPAGGKRVQRDPNAWPQGGEDRAIQVNLPHNWWINLLHRQHLRGGQEGRDHNQCHDEHLGGHIMKARQVLVQRGRGVHQPRRAQDGRGHWVQDADRRWPLSLDERP